MPFASLFMPAAKKRNKSKPINLIPEEGLSSTTSGRVLLWALSTFRIILIVTELVVIGAFISRFWLDAKNSDITQQMNETKNSIASLSSFESDFRDIQNRLQIFNDYTQNNTKINSNLETLISYKPDGISFKTASVSLDNLTITAVSASEIEIEQYYLNLKSSNKFKNIKIQDISVNKENSSLNFTLSAEINIES